MAASPRESAHSDAHEEDEGAALLSSTSSRRASAASDGRSCLTRVLCCSGSGYSRNVAYTLWYTCCDGACYSLWGMQLLPLYLQAITTHVSAIGIAATLSGLMQLAGALGAGYVADRRSRQLCIRMGMLCAVAAIVVFLCALWLSSVPLMFAGQALWGLYTGTTSTSVEALFADSVHRGQRTSIYNTKWMLQTTCYVFGYGMSAALFTLWHNEWKQEKMRVVMTLGVAAHPLALLPLCLLRDAYAVQDEEVVVEEGVSVVVAASATVVLPEEARHESIVEEECHRTSSSAVPAPRASLHADSVSRALPAVVTPSQLLNDMRSGSVTAKNNVAVSLPPASTSLAEQLPGLAAPSPPPPGLSPTAVVLTSSSGSALDGDEDGYSNSDRDFASTQSLRHRRSSTLAPQSPQQSGQHVSPSSAVGGVENAADALAAAAPRRDSTGAPHFLSGVHASRWVSVSAVPYWMCSVDFLLSVGSGMSLPYFPPYFATDRHVSPAGLNGIFISATLLTALTSSALPWLITACKLGRIPTVLCVRVVGTTALLLLALAPADNALAALPATVALFLYRNALMNSVFGVTRSVIMDCVSRGSRGRWSAFESVTSFSWAGSAAAGGFITEKYGYHMNFLITAVVQFTATLLMIPAAMGARELDAVPPAPAVVIATAVSEAGDAEAGR